MKSVGTAIIVSFVYLLIYVLLAQLPFDWSTRLVMFMFSLSPIPVLWLVWRILKDPYEYKGSFDVQFYRDSDISSLAPDDE